MYLQRYWLDAARQQPERNDKVYPLSSVTVHMHPAGNLIRSDKPKLSVRARAPVQLTEA